MYCYSSVFISIFFNVNLDETVDTHTHSTREFCTCVHLIDTKWQPYPYVKNVTYRIPTWICVRIHICTFSSSVCTQFTIVSNTHAIYLHACGGLNTDVCSHNICIHVINNLSLSFLSLSHLLDIIHHWNAWLCQISNVLFFHSYTPYSHISIREAYTCHFW